MRAFERHDMIYLSRKGRELALLAARELNPGLLPKTGEAIMNPAIPGIARRREGDGDNALAIGFSMPFFIDGTRVRAASFAPAEHVDRVVTPFEAALIVPVSPGALKKREALERLIHVGAKCGVRVGLYGSFALELVTGLEYTTADSDLDIFVRPDCAAPELSRFFELALEIQSRHGVRFDVEARCKGGYGVKLRELLSDSRTVLGKGLFDARLLSRSDCLFAPD